MSAARGPGIVGVGETPSLRHPGPGTSTAGLMAEAIAQALRGAGLKPGDVDGLGVASFTLRPDRAIDLAWRLGLRLSWCMQDEMGGASAINLLRQAWLALQAGQAETIVLVAGDHFTGADFAGLVRGYNRSAQDYLSPLGCEGPNPLFAMLTQRQMAHTGLRREDYGALCVAQRLWAAGNPNAAYRDPLSLAQYLAAPMVAPPLGRLDCVPVVSGACALVLSARPAGISVRLLASDARYNDDQQEGDGLQTGIAAFAPALWQRAGLGPEDMDVLSVYDDYPAMALAQLCDLGFASIDDLPGFIARRLATRDLPVNTAGGQLSAGQAGTAGGMHGLVEVARQLLGQAGERQVRGARHGVATGYGMVQLRYGMCANAAVLAREEA
ncbi:DitF protein [Achromobacter xylosoxidans]|uniref:thiolase family protein n=1 Tax=Achromobacter aegrifaciens TaxID=1287736 RepID=UPI000D4CC69B|nr:thiolase family protein [Achromobacter aegrifaciens]MDQ1760184.1 thiolase family protein [Achromobacter aegrifaciens]PTN48872.1 DitF protein [Achromobacter xylosoxidans]